MRPRVELDFASMKRRLEARVRDFSPTVEEILHLVGERTVEHLRSYTGEQNRRGRPLHPGGWADRTYRLRESFYSKVRKEDGALVLEIGNTAPHAHLVEARDGMFVVRGVAEPGGPVRRGLAKAVAELAPDWVVK